MSNLHPGSYLVTQCHPGHVSPPTSPGIGVPFNPHRGPNICISFPSRSIQVTSHLLPRPMYSISPQSMSWHLHLNTIQVSHVSIQVPIHESDLHPGPYIRFYTPSRSCITFTTVQRLASQPHSGPIWLPSRSRYLHSTSIHVPIWAFPHPGNIATPPRPWDFVLITIHVLKFASQHHPVNSSHAPCPEILHLHHIQASRHTHLTSIQVLSHLHPGPKIRIWSPCMLHRTFIWISPSRSQELHFHPGPIPPTSRSPDVPQL